VSFEAQYIDATCETVRIEALADALENDVTTLFTSPTNTQFASGSGW